MKKCVWAFIIMMILIMSKPRPATAGCEDLAVGIVVGIGATIFGQAAAHEYCHHNNCCNCRECGRVYLSEEPRYTTVEGCRVWHPAWTEVVEVPGQYINGEFVPYHRTQIYHPGYYEGCCH